MAANDAQKSVFYASIVIAFRHFAWDIFKLAISQITKGKKVEIDKTVGLGTVGSAEVAVDLEPTLMLSAVVTLKASVDLKAELTKLAAAQPSGSLLAVAIKEVLALLPAPAATPATPA